MPWQFVWNPSKLGHARENYNLKQVRVGWTFASLNCNYDILVMLIKLQLKKEANNMQTAIFNGLQDIVVALIGVFFAFMVAYIKQHFSTIQIKTATGIATEAVNFAVQAAKKFGITEDLAKYNAALTKAKELASKAGLNFTDSQWETLLESAYKKAKGELSAITGSTYNEDDVVNLIKIEVEKVAPSVPVDTILKLIQQELGKLSVSVNVGAPLQTDPVSDSPTEVAS